MDIETWAEIVAREAGITRTRAKRAVKAIAQVVRTKLMEGESVKLHGIGVLEAHTRGEYLARNPMTGERMLTPATRTIRFRAGEHLKKAANGIG